MITALILVILIPVLMYSFLYGKKLQLEAILMVVDAIVARRFRNIPEVRLLEETLERDVPLMASMMELYMKLHEEGIGVEGKLNLDATLTETMAPIPHLIRSHSTLNTDERAIQLLANIDERESQLQNVRRAYNQAVMELNMAIEPFPLNMIASSMHLERRPTVELSVALLRRSTLRVCPDCPSRTFASFAVGLLHPVKLKPSLPVGAAHTRADCGGE